MTERYKIALVQMDTGNDKEKNMAYALECIGEAARAGASLVCFPEVMNLIGRNVGAGGGREPVPGYSTDLLMKKAAECGVFVHGGSITEEIPGESRSYNTSVFIGPDGSILAKYRKLHTFDITLADGTEFRESDRVCPGREIVVASTRLGTFGMSVCYDVRFPELYRLLAMEGAEAFFVPASFTAETGAAHWETLLRARAIENGCYVIAAGQTGTKPAYKAYGHSMLVDPWGNVTVQAGTEPGIFYGELDPDLVRTIRSQMPSLKNRRPDVYTLMQNPEEDS